MLESTYSFKAYWLRDAPPVQHSTILYSAHSVFTGFVLTSEQIATSAPIQHTLIGFYNWDEKRLLRGTDCL
jgi:hypothetical protein